MADERSATWRVGHEDGYRVGPDGIDPAGNPVGPDGYNAGLMAELDYRDGLRDGRSDRIDEQLASGTHAIQQGGWLR